MDYNAIYNEDAFDLLPMVEDEQADLVILDPDYQNWNSYCEQGIICQAVRILKPTGNIICFTKQPFDYELRQEVNHIFRREIIWSFSNGGAWVSNKMPLVSFQKIFWLTVSKNFYVDVRTGLDYSDKTKSVKRKNKVFEGYNKEGKDFVKSDEGTWIRDHLHFNKPQMGSIPAKPIELIDLIVKCFSPIGGLVVDPFSGSGQVALSCQKQNRNFIACESNPITYEFSTKRLKEPQTNLFKTAL